MQVGADPSTAPRYSYVSNAHGDVVDLVDASGTVAASYAYDTWGNLTSVSESFTSGWSNPYRYDGRDGVRYDAADGLYWMSVRAYDPTIGRFIARDPLGRAPLFFADQPYAYAGNNPVSNVDPSGQYRAAGTGADARHESWKRTKRHFARIAKKRGCDKACQAQRHIEAARAIAREAEAYFKSQVGWNPTPLTTPDPEIFALEVVKEIGKNLLKSSIAFLIDAATMGFFAYMIVSAFAMHLFDTQTQENDAYWLSPKGVEGDWSWIGVVMGLGVGLLDGLVIPLLAALTVPVAPWLLPVWVGLEVGFMVSMIVVLQHVKKYIDEEEQVLGYPRS